MKQTVFRAMTDNFVPKGMFADLEAALPTLKDVAFLQDAAYRVAMKARIDANSILHIAIVKLTRTVRTREFLVKSPGARIRGAGAVTAW